MSCMNTVKVFTGRFRVRSSPRSYVTSRNLPGFSHSDDSLAPRTNLYAGGPHPVVRLPATVFLRFYLWFIRWRFLSSSDYKESNGRVVGEWWTEKDVEVSGRGLFQILFRHFPGRCEENHDSSCYGFNLWGRGCVINSNLTKGLKHIT